MTHLENDGGATPRFAGGAVRVILSFLVVAGVLTVVYLAAVVRVVIEKSYDITRENVAISGTRKPRSSGDVEKTPWPQFPGCQVSIPSAMMINGVRTIGEQWVTSASAAEILGFLKEQMEARGWVDFTEEAYGLNPEFRSQDGRKGLLSEDYVKTYAATIDSCLVMRDRSRFMQVSLEPGEERGRIRASLFAAETPFYEAFSRGLALSLGGVSPFGIDSVAEFSEKSSGHAYNTRLVNSRMDRAAAASEMIERLKAQKWMAVVVSLPQTEEQGNSLALFQRGDEYAYLTVMAAEDGNGSLALLTEATEDQDK
ncbi:MAG: hypothetical protein WCP86_00565 [bacterium]